jgi:hypothetical protein
MTDGTNKPLPDRVVVGPPVEPGSKAHHVIHMTTKDGQPAVGSGILTPAEDGQAVVTGTVVHIGEQRGVSPMGPVYDAETLAELPQPRPRQDAKGRAGPAYANTEAFREGWDRVFGGKRDERPN